MSVVSFRRLYIFCAPFSLFIYIWIEIATFGGSGGIMPIPRPSLGSRFIGGESNVTMCSNVHNTLVQHT